MAKCTVMALIWLCSKSISFSLPPFAIYSTFHSLCYVCNTVIPTLVPTSRPNPTPSSGTGLTVQPPLSQCIAKCVAQNFGTFMRMASHLEVLLWARVFVGALVYKNSWVLVFCYTLFLRVRYAQSSFLRQVFRGLERTANALLTYAGVPACAMNAWNNGKDVCKQIVRRNTCQWRRWEDDLEMGL